MQKKVALILHGWPQYEVNNHFLAKHLRKKGYQIFGPNLFDTSITFNLTNIKKLINTKLSSRYPDLIVGISFGGVVLPSIAINYPKAKLVFVATAPSFRPKPALFNLFLKIAKYKWAILFGDFVLSLPYSVLKFIYKIANPFKGDMGDRVSYEEDLTNNLRYIMSISSKKNIELVEFAKATDNTDLLSKLSNKALIFTGKNDHFMPFEAGSKLHRLLKNSELIINEGEHFNVLSEKDLNILDEFILKP